MGRSRRAATGSRRRSTGPSSVEPLSCGDEEERFPGIGPLEPEAAELGVDYTAGAIKAILEESGGYPYFLQEWRKAAWNAAADRQIDETAIAVAAVEVAEAPDEEFSGSEWGGPVRRSLSSAAPWLAWGRTAADPRGGAGDGARAEKPLADSRGVDSEGLDLPCGARADRVYRPTLRALPGARASELKLCRS